MRPRQFTDEELVETARALFLKHGAQLSTATIAAELGVSQAALFKRIGSKAELLRRVVGGHHECPAWIFDVEEPPDDRPPREQLLEHGRRIDRFFERAMPIMAMAKASGMSPKDVFPDTDRPPPVRAQQALATWFARLGRDGRARVDNPEGLAVLFLGGIQARHAMQHVFPGYASGGPDFVATLVDVVWAGIAPQPDSDQGDSQQ